MGAANYLVNTTVLMEGASAAPPPSDPTPFMAHPNLTPL